MLSYYEIRLYSIYLRAVALRLYISNRILPFLQMCDCNFIVIYPAREMPNLRGLSTAKMAVFQLFLMTVKTKPDVEPTLPRLNLINRI